MRLSLFSVDIMLTLKLKTPYFRASPEFCNYSSSSRVTTCSVTSLANLQDTEVILSGIERNSHIICSFLSLSYPWDKCSVIYKSESAILLRSHNLFGQLFCHYLVNCDCFSFGRKFLRLNLQLKYSTKCLDLLLCKSVDSLLKLFSFFNNCPPKRIIKGWFWRVVKAHGHIFPGGLSSFINSKTF